MACEESLAESVDVGNPTVEGEHDRETTEEHNRDHEAKEAANREREVGVVELVEGDDGADIDKGNCVEEPGVGKASGTCLAERTAEERRRSYRSMTFEKKDSSVCLLKKPLGGEEERGSGQRL